MPKSTAKSIRNLQLLEANVEDDKAISRLEKLLKLKKKRKKKNDGSKKIHNMFVVDGLDYILGAVDGDNRIDFSAATDYADDPKETSKHSVRTTKQPTKPRRLADLLGESSSNQHGDDHNSDQSGSDDCDDEKDDGDEMSFDDDKEEELEEKDDMQDDDDTMEDENDEQRDELVSDKPEVKKKKQKKKPKIWEDIYGRYRDQSGNVIDSKEVVSGTYVPPAKRKKMENNNKQKQETNLKIKRQLKGLLNRLSESNLQSICSQIEQLYMKNSRNDMNETLLSLVAELVLSPILTPARLIMEQALMVSLLHVNVGSEVGAYFLQHVSIKFQELFQTGDTYGPGKQSNNLLIFLCHLYNFKVTNCILIFDVLEILVNNFADKDIELIQLILKSVGFSLRKDNPLKLKEVILLVQKKAPTYQSKEDSSRVQFMLDTLTAVKNNNMYKIPDYDNTIIDHAKKVLRTMFRTGLSSQELVISFQDLLKAEEKGRWWIVGSAWSERTDNQNESNSDVQSFKLPQSVQVTDRILELAKKQHMNTEIRKTIFCIIVTGEDYMDCFEKLLRLNLKNQQDCEIISVLLHCLLNEKKFNPYYAFLAGKFCKFARKYQMSLQFSLWDKFKEMHKMKGHQVDNLAHFLKHLFLKGDLPISVLKVVHFSEMNKVMVRFFRQILLGILLDDSDETYLAVFRRIAPAKNLNLLKEGLRLFIHHFLLRKNSKLDEVTIEKLNERTKAVESILNPTTFKL